LLSSPKRNKTLKPHKCSARNPVLKEIQTLNPSFLSHKAQSPKRCQKLTTILKTLNHLALEYPSSNYPTRHSLSMEDVIDYLKHSIGAQTSLLSSLLNPLHFTNSWMQTRFALPLNPNPAFQHHLLKNNRVVLSNLHQVNFPPLPRPSLSGSQGYAPIPYLRIRHFQSWVCTKLNHYIYRHPGSPQRWMQRSVAARGGCNSISKQAAAWRFNLIF
jgi:hypothetical protein